MGYNLPYKNALFKSWHSNDATDDARVDSEKHSAEAGCTSQKEDAPVIDLWGVDFHRIVVDELLEDIESHTHLV